MDIKKAIPIGIESYKEIIDNDYCYVDKTLLIRDLLVQKAKLLCLPVRDVLGRH